MTLAVDAVDAFVRARGTPRADDCATTLAKPTGKTLELLAEARRLLELERRAGGALAVDAETLSYGLAAVIAAAAAAPGRAHLAQHAVAVASCGPVACGVAGGALAEVLSRLGITRKIKKTKSASKTA